MVFCKYFWEAFGVGEGRVQEKHHFLSALGLDVFSRACVLLAGHAACLPACLCSGPAGVSGLGGRQVLVRLICLARTLSEICLKLIYLSSALTELAALRTPRRSPPLLFSFPPIIFHTVSISIPARRAQE